MGVLFCDPDQITFPPLVVFTHKGGVDALHAGDIQRLAYFRRQEVLDQLTDEVGVGEEIPVEAVVVVGVGDHVCSIQKTGPCGLKQSDCNCKNKKPGAGPGFVQVEGQPYTE